MRSHVIASCVVFVVLVCVCDATTPPRPRIPKSFFTHANVIAVAGSTIAKQELTLWNDKEQRMSRFNYVSEIASYKSNLTLIQGPSKGQYQTINGLCRKLQDQAPMILMFEWVVLANFDGTEFVNGKLCDIWTFSLGETFLKLFVHNQTTPVRFVFSQGNVLQQTDYSVFEPGPQRSSLYAVPRDCTDRRLCAGMGVIDLPIIRFHPQGDLSLLDKNVADLIGDTVYICTLVTAEQKPWNTYISHWRLSVDSMFGIYAFCNGGVCIGGDEQYVGQEASHHLTDNSGHCHPNPVVGNWYSLPTGGVCNDTQSVGDNGCTWKPVQRMKTVHLSCVRDHGLTSACLEEFPFVRAQQIIETAFSSTDFSQGGCPDTVTTTTTTTTENNNELINIHQQQHHQQQHQQQPTTTQSNELELVYNAIDFAMQLQSMSVGQV